jgi:predicted transcriptional regulator
MIDKLSADSATNYQIVSIIVHEDVYSSVQSRVKRYAEDIQAKLNNTKAIIYTVPRDITPQKIAALNEKLFYE